MRGKYWLLVLTTALLATVAILLLVMFRINEARTNLTLASPGAYNYLLQNTRNVGSFVDTLQDYRNTRDIADSAEQLRSQYRQDFDVLWGGFSVFDVRFRTQPEQQAQVSELIEFASHYLADNEHLMAADHALSDREISELIFGARQVSTKLINLGRQYFIYVGQLSDLWKTKLHRLYYSFWVCLVLLLFTGTLLTTLLLRSYRQSAQLVEISHKTQREMKRLIDELRSGKLENKAKDSFIAAASHDLRQPLHALGLFLGATEKHIVSEQGRQALAEAKNCAAELNKLFNSLLDLSRLDAGVIDVDMSDFRLDRLLTVVHHEYSAQARQAGMSLTINGSINSTITGTMTGTITGTTNASTDGNVNCSLLTVNSDALLLHRILRNLLDNAISHSGASQIRIDCQRGPECVRLTVSDNGCGVPAEEHTLVFSEYYQLKNPERDRSKGLGLGLFIVQRLCELLDIGITLESSAGSGTRFHLNVPLATADTLQEEKASVPPSVSEHSLDGALIAVIDDDASICRGMVAILESMDFDVIAAESADLLIEECLASSLVPDILLVDYRLRDNQTGDVAIQRVRSAFSIAFPAIVITGDTSPGRMSEAASSGFELLHKPVEPADLIDKIAQLLARVVQPASRAV